MNAWLLYGGLAAAGLLAGWALVERAEVYRLRAENTEIAADRDEAVRVAQHNADVAQTWERLHADAMALAEKTRREGDAAAARAANAEDAAEAAARAGEKEVIVYVQDLARVSLPCGLVRLLDNAADDTDGAQTGARRAHLSAAAGCASQPDTALSRLRGDHLPSLVFWLAEQRRKARARANELSAWINTHWRSGGVVSMKEN